MDRGRAYSGGDRSGLSVNAKAGVLKHRFYGSSSPGSKTVSFESSKLTDSRNAPPSPYFEEITDTGEDEGVGPVEEYHADPPLFFNHMPSRLHDHVNRSPTPPPRVVIRSPTDPKGLEAQIQVLRFDSPVDDSIPGDILNEKFGSNDQQSSSHAYHLGSSSSHQPFGRSQSKAQDDIEARLRRVQAEIEMRPDPKRPARSTSSHRHSLQNNDMPLNMKSPSGLRPLHTSRPRASTATGLDSRPTMNLPSDHLANYPGAERMPYLSPRYSPMSPSLRSPRIGQYREEGRPKGYKSRRSPVSHPSSDFLPSLLDPGLPTTRLTADLDSNSKRRSWAGDFGTFLPQSYDFAFQEPDPPLFHTSPDSNLRRHARGVVKNDLPRGVTQKTLPVSLKDMCLGANKKVRFKRWVPDEMGAKLVEDTKVLTLRVYPGLMPGSTIKHSGEGDYDTDTGQLGQVWFVLEEINHPVFERNDRNLHTEISVSLCEALCGFSKTLVSICGKEVKIRHPGPMPHGWQEYFAGLGMPRFDHSNREIGQDRGDMVVDVKVIMPSRLDELQKDLIRKALNTTSPRRR